MALQTKTHHVYKQYSDVDNNTVHTPAFKSDDMTKRGAERSQKAI